MRGEESTPHQAFPYFCVMEADNGVRSPADCLICIGACVCVRHM